MLHTSLGYILVRSFPECAVMLIVGCKFLNLKISTKTLLNKTFILGLIISLIRMLPISFGIHTIIGMGIILFVLANLSKNSFMDCIIAICKLFLCLIFSEVIYIKLITMIFLVPESFLVDNYSVISAIYTLPSLFIFVILAFAIEFIIKKIRGNEAVNHNEKYN